MAIDTAEKRKSVAGSIGYALGGPGVTPNASKDVEWRQESGYGYPGIALVAGQPIQLRGMGVPHLRGWHPWR